MIVFYDSRCTEYSRPGHPERPQRIAHTAPLLKDRHPDWEWRTPQRASESALLRAHSREHVEQIKAATEDFDADTPVYSENFYYALRPAGAGRGGGRPGR